VVQFLNNSVTSEEKINRFIFSQRYFNSQTRHISPQAFKPATPQKPERPEYQTSVYRTQNLDNLEIWSLGDEFVAPKRGMPILARGEVQAKIIFDQELQIKPDKSPHPRHANIVGWSESDEARQMAYLKISQEATLFIR